MEGSTIIYGSTLTVKSVTLQHDGESDSVNSTSLYGHGELSVFLLLDGARIQSVSELSGNSVNSAMPDGEVSYSKFSV